MTKESKFTTEQDNADEVVEAHVTLAKYQAAEDALLDTLWQDPTYQKYVETREKRIEAQRDVNEKEAKYAEWAADVFDAGVRYLFTLGQIKQVTEVDYREGEAVSWLAQTGLLGYLKVSDKVGFEQLVKSMKDHSRPYGFMVSEVSKLYFDRKKLHGMVTKQINGEGGDE